MARLKNALRGHFIAPLAANGDKPSSGDYLELAKWISNITDNTDEITDNTAYYDGDGTQETTVTGVAGAYSFEGSYDEADPAQAYIADLKYKLGDDRKVWHKVVSSDGTKQWEGIATVSAIKAGDGNASDFEAFACTITYNELPIENTVTP